MTPAAVAAAVEAARQLPLLPEAAQCGHLYARANGLVVRANGLLAAWSGRPLSEIEGLLRLRDLLAPGSRLYHDTHYAPLLALQGSASEISLDFRTPAGETVPVLANARVQPATDTGPALTSVTFFAATATRRHERELRAARRQAEDSADELAHRNGELQAQGERLRVTLQSMSEAVLTTDASGCIDSVNAAAEALLGVLPADLLGARFSRLVELIDAVDRRPLPSPVGPCLQRRQPLTSPPGCALLRPDDLVRRVEYTAAPLLAGAELLGMVWVCRDVSEQHDLAQRIDRDLRHDALTGLVNRREFERLIDRAAREPAAGDAGDLLCYLDLDQFKVVNDTAGHAAGDALILDVSRILRARIRQSDTLARLGGDEFGLLLSGCSPDDGIACCNALREAIAAHRFAWQGGVHSVSVSIGIAPLTGRDGHSAQALSDADVACNAAKEAGRNRIHFAAEADAQIEGRRGEMHWVAQLHGALANDRFVLYAQPIVATAAPQAGVSHAEILLRLRRDDGQLVPPALFIPAAERYQLMGALDRWVFRNALAWMGRAPWAQCSINVSGQSLGDEAFLDDITAEFERHAVDPRRVCFEITETAAIGNLAAAHRFIAAWRGRGSRFALDDFGAGLSSFAYLRQLDVDVVKIDGSFVKDMHQDPQNHAIVESIHRVARISGLKTVAEWVENDAILGALRAIGVDYAQGYGIGKPAPLADWREPAVDGRSGVEAGETAVALPG